MGAAVARRLVDAGCTVLTSLEGRSEATRRRAKDAGMQDASLIDIARRARWVLSIVPPKDAGSFAREFADALASVGSESQDRDEQVRGFADCNAVSPDTVKRIAEVFEGSRATFVDGCIIGGPPTPDGGYDPTSYASVAPGDGEHLDAFVGLGQFGLKIAPLSGENTGIGDASALKMFRDKSDVRDERLTFIRG
ncbi:hypothetical protein HGRIS_002362 [Hohenbuehelia grisea]|uniref:6-phosphogluconate dehydrogenase NADP-binding domain-containing protein n=1 Tax=Hohenbuehelia grisea TaxID=104357 RepID=A0ABR3JL66_9AGAR